MKVWHTIFALILLLALGGELAAPRQPAFGGPGAKVAKWKISRTS